MIVYDLFWEPIIFHTNGVIIKRFNPDLMYIFIISFEVEKIVSSHSPYKFQLCSSQSILDLLSHYPNSCINLTWALHSQKGNVTVYKTE